MSIAHLPDRSPRVRRPRVDAAEARDRAARERVQALITQIDGTRLGAAEELLSGIVSHQQVDTRALTGAEVAILGRLGVSEAELVGPSSFPAKTRSTLFEFEMQQWASSAADVAELLGVTPARVRQRCAAGTLLAQRRPDGWFLPMFQFPEGRELPGWPIVSSVIAAGTPLLLVERVLTSPALRLQVEGETLAPFDWLAQGGDPVVAAAAVDDALNRLP